MRRALRRRRRTLAAGLAVAAATLALGGRAAPEPTSDAGAATASAPAARPVELVSAPVRIADAAAVRLLEPGDRVDVVAAGEHGEQARVVAADARVAQVPEAGEESLGGGALVVLEVPRSVSTALVGAGADTPLAVTLR